MNPPSSPSDTRPIANLCELSKVFERVVHKQIIEYINMNNILNSRQSGFRGGYSTQSALLRVCHDVRHVFDMGRVTILVLFDFSRAFDTVSHSKLLIKLRGFGFSDVVLTWVSLTSRIEPRLLWMREVDARVGWLLLWECPRVQFWVPSYLRYLSMTSVLPSNIPST